MPIGIVKWYDSERGFGFVTNPGDEDCYVGRSVLPAGVEELLPGSRIEFDVASGRRGPQALRVVVLEEPRRRKPQHKYTPVELGSLVADLITLLEGEVQPRLLANRYPERKEGRKVAEILRALAKELDA